MARAFESPARAAFGLVTMATGNNGTNSTTGDNNNVEKKEEKNYRQRLKDGDWLTQKQTNVKKYYFGCSEIQSYSQILRTLVNILQDDYDGIFEQLQQNNLLQLGNPVIWLTNFEYEYDFAEIFA